MAALREYGLTEIIDRSGFSSPDHLPKALANKMELPGPRLSKRGSLLAACVGSRRNAVSGR